MKGNGASATFGERQFAGAATATAEGPSCIYVGPIETASKETLEALYRQVRCFSFSFSVLFSNLFIDKNLPLFLF